MPRLHPNHNEDYLVFSLEQIQEHLTYANGATLKSNITPTDTQPREDVAPMMALLLQKIQSHPSFAIIDLQQLINYAKTQKLPELVEYEKTQKSIAAPQMTQFESESVVRLSASVQDVMGKARAQLQSADPLYTLNSLLTKMLLTYLNADILPKARDEFDAAQEVLRKQREEEEMREREMRERERMQREKELKRQMLKQGAKPAQPQEEQPTAAEPSTADDASQSRLSSPSSAPQIESLPYPTPKKFILLQDFPKNIFQVRHLQHEAINFDCLVGLIAQECAGPPPPLPQYQKAAEEAPTGKGAKDAKKAPPAKKDAGKKDAAPAAPLTPLYNQLQVVQHQLSQNNEASFLRNPLFVPLSFNIYQYNDDMQELNTGNDLDYEANRMLKLLEESLAQVASGHRSYYNAVQQNQFVGIARGGEQSAEDVVTNSSLAPPQVSTSYYRTLMDSIPADLVSVPLLMHCLVEQVVKNVEFDTTSGESTDNFVPDDKKINVDSAQVEDELDTLFDSFHKVNERSFVEKSAEEAQAFGAQDATTPDSPSSNKRRPSHLSVGMNNPPTYEPYQQQQLGSSGPALSNDGPPVVEYGDKISLRKTKHKLLGETLFDIEMEMLTKLDIFPRNQNAVTISQQQQQQPASNAQDDTSTIHPLTVPDITSVAERGSRLTELHNFIAKDVTQKSPHNTGRDSSASHNTQKYLLSMKQLQKELTLFKFEELLEAQRKLEGTTPRNVDFSDRTFQEDFSREAFIQVLASHASSLGTSCSVHAKPQLYSSYYDLEDAALLIYAQNVDESGKKFSTTSGSFSKLFEIPAYYGEYQQERQLQFVNTLQDTYTAQLERHHAELEEKRLQAKLEAEAKERRKRERRQKALKDKEGAAEEVDETPAVEQENANDAVASSQDDASTTPQTALHTPTPKRNLLSQSTNETYYFSGHNANIHYESLQFYPNDGALVHLYSYNRDEKLAAANAARPVSYRLGCSVFKDGIHFGFKSHCTRSPGKEKSRKNNTLTRSIQDGYFTATFEDDTCITAVSANLLHPRRTPSLTIATKSGLFVQQSFHSGEVMQLLNPPSNSHYIPEADYTSAFAAKRTFVGSGYKQLIRNALHNMSAFMSREDEPLLVWNPQREAVETVLSVEKYRTIVPESFCIVRYLDAVVPPQADDASQQLANLVQILYSNGETAVYHSTYDMWLKTNHDGSRVIFPRDAPAAQQQIESVNCSTNIDAETGAQVYTREDFVMQIIYSDNRTRFVQFTDGSRVWTHEREVSATGEETPTQVILFEHPRFATVEVDTQSLATTVEVQGVCLSSRNPQQQVAHFVKDAHEFEFAYASDAEYATVRLASRHFYEQHNKVQLKPLFGVYQCHYGYSNNGGGLKSIDLEGNEFLVQATGRAMIRYRNPVNPIKDRSLSDLDQLLDAHADSFSQAENVAQFLNLCTIGKPRITAPAPEDPQNIHARLFLLRRYDGSGCELISEVQTFPYIEAAKRDDKTEFSEDRDPTMNLTALTFLTEVHSQSNSVLAIRDRPLPQSLLPLKFGGNSRNTSDDAPLGHLHRRLVKFPAINEQQRTQMKAAYEKWKEWYVTRDRMQERLQQETETQQAIAEEDNPVRAQIEKHIQEKVLPQLQEQESVYAAEVSVTEEETAADENVAASVDSDEEEQSTTAAADTNTPRRRFVQQSQKLDNILNTSQVQAESPVHARNVSPQKAAAVNYWQTMNGSQVLDTLRSTKTVEEQELDQMLDLHRTLSPRKKLAPLSASSRPDSDAQNIERNMNNLSRISQAEQDEESGAEMDAFDDSHDDISPTDMSHERNSSPARSTENKSEFGAKRRRIAPPRIHVDGSEDANSTARKSTLRSFAQSPSVYSTLMSPIRSPGMSGNALEVYPTTVDFGPVAPNRVFTTQFMVTNVSATPCRFVLKYKNSRSNPLSANLNATGPLSGGLNRKVLLKLDTSKVPLGETFEAAVHIKHAGGVLTVPVSAKVVGEGLTPNHLNRKNSQIKDLGASSGEISMHL